MTDEAKFIVDEKEIEKAKNNNICPICLSVGSLFIDHPTEKGGVQK